MRISKALDNHSASTVIDGQPYKFNRLASDEFEYADQRDFMLDLSILFDRMQPGDTIRLNAMARPRLYFYIYGLEPHYDNCACIEPDDDATLVFVGKEMLSFMSTYGAPFKDHAAIGWVFLYSGKLTYWNCSERYVEYLKTGFKLPVDDIKQLKLHADSFL